MSLFNDIFDALFRLNSSKGEQRGMDIIIVRGQIEQEQERLKAELAELQEAEDQLSMAEADTSDTDNSDNEGQL